MDGVSFEVRGGEIFGLLGPNGAGKTTLIRILMDILRPDAGRVLIDGRPSWDADKDRVGYLPEERGLYRKQRVADVLVYFGRLKGMSAASAREAARARSPAPASPTAPRRRSRRSRKETSRRSRSSRRCSTIPRWSSSTSRSRGSTR